MNSTENQIHEVELSIEAAQEQIELMKSLDTLTKNEHFKRVIEEGYFQKEASRLVLLRADPNMNKPEDQERLLKMLDSIGFLREYLRAIYQIGRMSEKSLKDDMETRSQLMEEVA